MSGLTRDHSVATAQSFKDLTVSFEVKPGKSEATYQFKVHEALLSRTGFAPVPT